MIRSFDNIQEGGTYFITVSNEGPVNLYFKVENISDNTESGTDIHNDLFESAIRDISLDPEDVDVKRM